MFKDICKYYLLRGMFPQATMWIGWVESNIRNQQYIFEQIWIIHLSELKICRVLYVALSGWNSTMQNLWFHKRTILHWLCRPTYIYKILNCSWVSIVQLIKFNHKCMHNHLSPNIIREGRYLFIFCCDITDCSRSSATWEDFENHSAWLEHQHLPNFCY